MFTQSGQVVRAAKHKHPAIPQEAPARDELLGALTVRLLDEAARSKYARIQLAAHFDVPVTRLGAGRANANRHVVAVCRGFEAPTKGVGVGFRVADVVVSREDGHHRVWIEPLHVRGRPTDAWGRVATDGLGEDLLRRKLR